MMLLNFAPLMQNEVCTANKLKCVIFKPIYDIGLAFFFFYGEDIPQKSTDKLHKALLTRTMGFSPLNLKILLICEKTMYSEKRNFHISTHHQQLVKQKFELLVYQFVSLFSS